jgi:hypothetical protein
LKIPHPWISLELKTTIIGIPPRSSKLGISLGLGFPLHFKDLEKKSPNYIWRAPSMDEYPS